MLRQPVLLEANPEGYWKLLQAGSLYKVSFTESLDSVWSLRYPLVSEEALGGRLYCTCVPNSYRKGICIKPLVPFSLLAKLAIYLQYRLCFFILGFRWYLDSQSTLRLMRIRNPNKPSPVHFAIHHLSQRATNRGCQKVSAADRFAISSWQWTCYKYFVRNIFECAVRRGRIWSPSSFPLCTNSAALKTKLQKSHSITSKQYFYLAI